LHSRPKRPPSQTDPDSAPSLSRDRSTCIQLHDDRHPNRQPRSGGRPCRSVLTSRRCKEKRAFDCHYPIGPEDQRRRRPALMQSQRMNPSARRPRSQCIECRRLAVQTERVLCGTRMNFLGARLPPMPAAATPNPRRQVGGDRREEERRLSSLEPEPPQYGAGAGRRKIHPAIFWARVDSPTARKIQPEQCRAGPWRREFASAKRPATERLKVRR